MAVSLCDPAGFYNESQQAAFTEHLSNALGAASRSELFSTEWQASFLAGISDHPSTVGNVGELIRYGDFSTDFLMAAMRELVNVQDYGRGGFGANHILEAVARNPEAAALSSAAFAPQMLDNSYLSNWAVGAVFEAGAVDISPAATIQAYEQRLMAEYAEMGNWGFSVDADFTVPDGNGGLQIMPLEDMSAAQRGAYVEWISTPEVQQVLLQQVNSQNQAHDDVPFGMGD